MKLQIRYLLGWLVCTGVLFSSCEKKWDERTEINNPLLGENLFEQINKNPELSKFGEYLVKTGYDQVLESSKTFTVWAPTNKALQELNPATIDSDEKLKLFVANHLANQSYISTQLPEPSFKIKTLNGKSIFFTSTTIDGFELLSKDLYVGNGVLHTINTALSPKVNAWQYLMSTSSVQKKVLESNNYTFFDFNLAEVGGINPTTGAPIYKDGTGKVTANRFLNRYLRKATDISNEDSLFTYIVLSDAAFQAERTKLNKYYKLGTKDSTDSLTDFNIIKDLAFRGVLKADNFPGTAYSIGDSVAFHLNKNDIMESHKVSNGIVYVMNKLNYELADGSFYAKLKPILIQAEFVNNNTDFLSIKPNTTPVKRNPDGLTSYRQLRAENHATSAYWVKYKAPIANSITYKVYWRVVRDFNMVPAGTATDLVYFPMRLAFKSPAVTPNFNYIPKPGVVKTGNMFQPDYSEVFLGHYTSDKFYSTSLSANSQGALPIYLVGNTSTVNGTNTLLLDYIKMVPIP